MKQIFHLKINKCKKNKTTVFKKGKKKKINDYSIETPVRNKRKMCNSFIAVTSIGMKTLHFLWNTVLSYIENAAFMQV